MSTKIWGDRLFIIVQKIKSPNSGLALEQIDAESEWFTGNDLVEWFLANVDISSTKTRSEAIALGNQLLESGYCASITTGSTENVFKDAEEYYRFTPKSNISESDPKRGVDFFSRSLSSGKKRKARGRKTSSTKKNKFRPYDGTESISESGTAKSITDSNSSSETFTTDTPETSVTHEGSHSGSESETRRHRKSAKSSTSSPRSTNIKLRKRLAATAHSELLHFEVLHPSGAAMMELFSPTTLVSSVVRSFCSGLDDVRVMDEDGRDISPETMMEDIKGRKIVLTSQTESSLQLGCSPPRSWAMPQTHLDKPMSPTFSAIPRSASIDRNRERSRSPLLSTNRLVTKSFASRSSEYSELDPGTTESSETTRSDEAHRITPQSPTRTRPRFLTPQSRGTRKEQKLDSGKSENPVYNYPEYSDNTQNSAWGHRPLETNKEIPKTKKFLRRSFKATPEQLTTTRGTKPISPDPVFDLNQGTMRRTKSLSDVQGLLLKPVDDTSPLKSPRSAFTDSGTRLPLRDLFTDAPPRPQDPVSYRTGKRQTDPHLERMWSLKNAKKSLAEKDSQKGLNEPSYSESSIKYSLGSDFDRKPRSPKNVKSEKKPKREKLRSRDNKPKKKMLVELYQELVRLLVQPDHILAESLASFIQLRTDIETQPKIWRKIFTEKGGTGVLDLMSNLISRSVKETSRENTLFRGNDFPAVFMSTHARAVAENYLQDLLEPQIKWLMQKDFNSFEISPTKLQETGQEARLSSNKDNFLFALNTFLDAIICSIDSVPNDIRKISACLRKETESKFPKSVLTAVGGFYFLRLVCPTLVSPDKFGVTARPLTSDERRPLVLISKALQNLSNNVYFNEEYMQELNQWIDQKMGKMDSFLMMLADSSGSPTSYDDLDCTLSPQDYHLLFDLLERHFTPLIAQLQGNPLTEQLPYPLISTLNTLVPQILHAEQKEGIRKKKK